MSGALKIHKNIRRDILIIIKKIKTKSELTTNKIRPKLLLAAKPDTGP